MFHTVVCKRPTPVGTGLAPFRTFSLPCVKGAVVFRRKMTEGFLQNQIKSTLQSLRLTFVRHGRKSSKCNTFGFENLGGSFPVKAFSWAVVDKIDNFIYSFLSDSSKIKAFWEKEP